MALDTGFDRDLSCQGAITKVLYCESSLRVLSAKVPKFFSRSP